MTVKKNNIDGKDSALPAGLFRCPACKSDLQFGENGSLLCTHCEGNAVSEGPEQTSEAMSDAYRLCEEVVRRMAGGPNRKELAGLVRVCLHWHHRQRPEFFTVPRSAGISREVVRQYLARHVERTMIEHPIFCCDCDTMLIDSDPESPLECLACGSKDVEPRSMLLLQIAHMAKNGIPIE